MGLPSYGTNAGLSGLIANASGTGVALVVSNVTFWSMRKVTSVLRYKKFGVKGTQIQPLSSTLIVSGTGTLTNAAVGLAKIGDGTNGKGTFTINYGMGFKESGTGVLMAGVIGFAGQERTPQIQFTIEFTGATTEGAVT